MRDDEEAVLEIARVMAYAPSSKGHLDVQVRSADGQNVVLQMPPQQALEMLLGLGEFLESRARRHPNEGAVLRAAALRHAFVEADEVSRVAIELDRGPRLAIDVPNHALRQFCLAVLADLPAGPAPGVH